jgi:hypothetical protein
MQDAISAVCAFAAELQFLALTVECCTPSDKPLNFCRTFFDQHSHGFGIAQPIACSQGVLLVQRDIVIVAEGGCNTSLSVFRRRFAEAVLRDDDNATGRSELDSCAKSSYTRANNDEICTNALNRVADAFMI